MEDTWNAVVQHTVFGLKVSVCLSAVNNYVDGCSGFGTYTNITSSHL